MLNDIRDVWPSEGKVLKGPPPPHKRVGNGVTA
jgi:hypothetical protein